MKYFVRILSVLLIAAMAFSIVACSDDEQETEGKKPPVSGGTLDLGSDDPSASEDPSEEPTEAESATEEQATVDMESYEAPSLEKPTADGFELPTDAEIVISTVDPTATEDSTTVTVKAEAVHTGSLILVNPQYALKKDPADITDALVNMYDLRAAGNLKGKFQLKAVNITVQKEAYDSFAAMMLAANTANAKCGNVQVVDAYRSAQRQDDVFNAAGGVNSFEKNHSDFQTGYSLQLNYIDGNTYPLNDKNNADAKAAGDIIANLADDYGFIQRYPAGKSALTGLKDGVMPYLYRYVGIPHARVMAEGGYCLEEYIEFIKNYTEAHQLRVQDGESVYHVFYVPAAAEGADTTFNVPKNHDYTVSGNNVDGFIVTVTMTAQK